MIEEVGHLSGWAFGCGLRLSRRQAHTVPTSFSHRGHGSCLAFATGQAVGLDVPDPSAATNDIAFVSNPRVGVGASGCGAGLNASGLARLSAAGLCRRVATAPNISEHRRLVGLHATGANPERARRAIDPRATARRFERRVVFLDALAADAHAVTGTVVEGRLAAVVVPMRPGRGAQAQLAGFRVVTPAGAVAGQAGHTGPAGPYRYARRTHAAAVLAQPPVGAVLRGWPGCNHTSGSRNTDNGGTRAGLIVRRVGVALTPLREHGDQQRQVDLAGRLQSGLLLEFADGIDRLAPGLAVGPPRR